jgi:hypothetical protein
VERIPEDWKKYPLALIGTLPAIPPGALCLSLSALGSPGAPVITDFYLVVGVPAEELLFTLTALEACGADPGQIVIYGNPHECPEGFGSLESITEESAEELRARLLQKLQARRQLRLAAAFRQAKTNVLGRQLPEAQLMRTLDITRIAHALCCAYAVTPAIHLRLLHNCLAGEFLLPPTWSAEAPPEILIPETAALLYQALSQEMAPREALREKLNSLSYRARNELLHHVENCVGALTGGKHAA